MWKYHVLTFIVKPSASADVKHYLTVTDGEIIDAMFFCKAVGTKIVPFLYTEITLIKMDMDDAKFQTCFLYDACMFFSDIADFKNFKNTIWKNDIQQRFVC